MTSALTHRLHTTGRLSVASGTLEHIPNLRSDHA